MNRFIAMQSLEYLGFETTEAENGLVAIEKLRKSDFDIILMDIQMPEMDGVQATEYIREKLKNVETPIIALTANAFKHDIELYMRKGMSDFITKPYDEQDFFGKIDRVIRLSTAEKETRDAWSSSTKQALPMPNQLSLYDLTYLENLSHGNDAFLASIIELFIQMAKENIDIFESALLTDDIETIKKYAHKIKPSIDQMGIVSLKEVVRKIEKYNLEEGSKAELTELVGEQNNILSNVILQLETRN
jgi:CheY-like chemotaxis protein